MNEKLYPKVHRGDIFYANLGIRMGSEQDGRRPVLIIQNEIGNEYSPTVIVAVLTSKIKKLYLPTHLIVGTRFGLPEKSIVLFEQLTTIDRRRLDRYVGTLDHNVMQKANQALKVSLGLE